MSGRWWRLGGLLLSFLSLALRAGAQQPAALRRPVQLQPGRRPLGTVLAELARQGRLPLSYSSSLVPLAHRYQVRPGPARPLGDVLRDVLAAEHLTYGLLDGQLVLWPDRVAPPPGVVFLNGNTAAPKSALPDQPASAALAGQSAARAPAVIISRTPPATVNGSGPDKTTGTRVVRNAPVGGSAPATNPQAGFPTRVAHSQANLAVAAASRRTAPGRGSRPRSARGLARMQAEVAPPPTGAANSELALLPLRPAGLVLPAGAAPQVAAVPLVSRPTSTDPSRAGPDLARPLGGLYLRAEAWGSESLPVGTTAKVGIARAYLVVGAALAPAGRQNGVAFGVGLGTAGRARGRFTPNLDALAWGVGADHDQETPPILLLQLRPQVAWQVRRDSRLGILVGPTLNLATAHQRGPQTTRWDFARDQWLWVNQADGESLLRLWPGVQVGVRF